MSTHNPERRTLLRGALAAAGALYVPIVWAAESSPGKAEKPDKTEKPGGAPGGKISKARAKYQDQPKGDQQCSTCTHFIAKSSTCQVVEGKISPNGWSTLWAKKQA